MPTRPSKGTPSQPDPGDEQHASAEPPGQGSPDAAATSEAAAAPPADHAADPPPPGPGDEPAADGAGTPDSAEGAAPASAGEDTTAGPVTAAGGQVQGGRLADLGPRAMPPGVPYAIAREPLFVVNPEAAAAPVRAFNPGDRVPAELVEKFGWHDLTEIPEWAPAPPAPATPDNTGSEE